MIIAVSASPRRHETAERDVGHSAIPEPGDIIVRVNRQRVTNPGDISRAVVTSAPGQEIEFEVLRGSRSLVIRLILPKMLHL